MCNESILGGEPVTTDIPMLYDEKRYKVYIILKGDRCNSAEVKIVAKLCNINYISAKKKLMKKKNFILEGNAYMVMEILKKLSEYDVTFELEPPYPYAVSGLESYEC